MYNVKNIYQNAHNNILYGIKVNKNEPKILLNKCANCTTTNIKNYNASFLGTLINCHYNRVYNGAYQRCYCSVNIMALLDIQLNQGE